MSISIANMNEWTPENEAANLKRLLAGVGNKAQFAKNHKIPGGASMLSQQQSGHRPIGLEAGLIYAKALGVTLAEISPRLAKMVEDVPMLTNASNILLSEVGIPLETKEIKRIPVVGEVRGGNDGYLEDLEYPVGFGDGYIEFPSTDPNVYAVRVRGDSMHPRYRAGEFVVVEPNIEPQEGDDVVVICANGRKMLKQLNWRRDGEIQLLSVNDGYAPLTLAAHEINSIQLVAGRVRRSGLKH